MINVAIVEDNASDSNLIENYLKKYSELNNVKLNIKKFDEAISFLSEYKKIYNIIFMDIECLISMDLKPENKADR